MKKSKSASILDMFKNQKQIVCPACGLKLSQFKLNAHLDLECSSSNKSEVAINVDSKAGCKIVNENQLEADEGINDCQGLQKIKVYSDMKYDEIVKVKSEETDMLSTEIFKKLNKPKSIGNTSAPWRSQSMKRKQQMSPKKINTTKYQKIQKNHQSQTQLITTNTVKESEFINPDNHSLVPSESKTLEETENDFSSINFSEDMFENNEFENTPESQEHFSPYYLANFKLILSRVLEDNFNKHLFDDSDMSYVQIFNALSDEAQKLYVRLFQRKYKWLRLNQINYPQIADDLKRFLRELVESGLLDSGSSSMDLETALNLLSLPEAKVLSKEFKFNGSGKSKTEICQMLIKHGKQHKSIFSMGSKNSVSSAILKKVLQVLGLCYILQLKPKKLFTRILMLFSLPTMSEDDEEGAGGQGQQLLTLLRVNKGQVVFPTYKINRECRIFETRDDLIRYAKARELENDIMKVIESKNFISGKELYLQAEREFSELKSCGHSDRDVNLPQHLRRYTAGHVYIRCLNQGVEILQRLRQYEEAVQLLRILLEQTTYGQDRKGKWWERLALNLQQHLKRSDEAADAIKEAINDPNVRVGPRLTLLTRAKKLKSFYEDESQHHIDEMKDIIECPKVTIEGEILSHPISGRRNIFISSHHTDGERDLTVLSVEAVALQHYRSIGFPEGVHGEGSTFISLYSLLFWDIIYDGNIVDVFISAYQAHPLDLNSFDFYERRKSQIDNHLESIRNGSVENLGEIVRSSWEAHSGMTSLVNWEIFANVDHAVGLATCFGNIILAGICERLSKDFRFTRSGVPDLVVWNPEEKTVKIVEVKGPGDKLSTKQILWLDYLLKLGADAEVCLVEAVLPKRL